MLFKEEQKYGKIYVWIILIGSFIFMSGIIIMSYMESEAREEVSHELIFPLALVFTTFGGIIWLFANLKLETKIDRHGISYRYYPFIVNWRVINKRQIASYAVRTYNAIWEYGGYGFRTGFLRKNGRAYTTSGSMGLQLVLKNGKKILIGTQKPEEVERVMQKVME